MCSLSNGDIADDLEWPQDWPPTTQITLYYTLGVTFRVAVTGEDKNFKFGTDVHLNKLHR